tara:strand:- start:8551 stop:9222 length:672 start_codon:yes stop_codon:yes gene_type:complete
MSEESIEVVLSDDGNVSAFDADTTPAPSEPVVDVPVADLYELPDGRKVDAVTLQSEWKENFYPEFTRRSQELAELKRGTLETKTPSKFEDPEYTPQSYAEIIQAAKEAALNELAEKEQARITQQEAIENEVVQQLAKVKKLDATVNENQLFLHASKYGFRDLPMAYQNMKDMSGLAKTVQKTTAQNIAKRNDPVSVAPGGSVGTRPDPSAFGSAIEYMRSLNT